MAKSLLQVIQEAEEERKQPTQGEIDQWRTEVMQAKKTGLPKPISAIKAHLWNEGEYELYEFLDNSEFWEVGNKDAPHWYQTAAVRMGPSRIEFYYDKDFVDRLAKKPGELIFLIAHEASHILRYHIDRSEKLNHDGDRANTAQDMIINDDIMRTEKIAGWKPELATNASLFGDEGAKEAGVDPKGTSVYTVPEKFRKDFEEEGRKAFYYENMYNWLTANEDPKDKDQDEDEGEGEGEGAPPKDYYEEGSIVKVNDTGEYKKITKVNKDGTVETESVDIENEIERIKSGVGGKAKVD